MKKEKSKFASKKITVIVYIIVTACVALGTKILYDAFDDNGLVNVCDQDIQKINSKINETGQISTNDPLFIKLGVDGCADLSKSTHGMATQEISPP